MTARTKPVLLCGLLCVLLALIGGRWMTETEPQEVPLRFKSGPRPDAIPNQQGQSDEYAVRPMKMLGDDLPVTPKRNLFVPMERSQLTAVARNVSVRKPVKAAEPPPAPPPQVEVPVSLPPPPPQPSPEELAAVAARQQKDAMVRQLREQMGQYRYLGYLQQDGRQRAFLGRGADIFIIHEGDTLEGKFLVAGIETTVVILKERQNELEARLELKKGTGLGPS
ncbi:MAG: hypothetical protein H8K08_15895 [Nitrospira sp.]|nr:hypothetical protein [Nitrospira sp.]